jgi:hypothetical protein
MTLGTMLAATGVPRLFSRGVDRSGADAGNGRDSRPEVGHGEGTYRILWDQVDAGAAGPGADGGTLLFLWPRIRGDRRCPSWARRADDGEDENAPWWNREDGKVSAALLLPFYADLVARLSERAGPARFEFLGRPDAVGQPARRFDTGQRLRALSNSFLARSAPLDRLAALVEGAEDGDRAACAVIFGARAAVLHARRDERCLWLWLTPGVRVGFDLLREETGARFLRCEMDWTMTGSGLLAPRPPRLPRR